jgi:3-oxoacyl-[acyl-carrier protein] reductase
MSMSNVLDQRVAIVTGGAQGIGYGATKQLVEAGAKVIIVDIDAAQAERRAQEFGPDRVYPFVADLYDPKVPDQLMAFAREEVGGIDILVNNAGIYWDSLVHAMTDAQWQSVLDIHVTIPFRLLRAASPHFVDLARQDTEAGLDRRFRKVVNVSSGAAFGLPGAANYSAGKAGVLGLTRALAHEWRPHRVTVNAITFGVVATRFGLPQSSQNKVSVGGYDVQLGVPAHKRRSSDPEPKAHFSDEEIYKLKTLPDGSPMGGTIDDAGRVIFYFASPLSDLVTGEVHNLAAGYGYGIW